MGGQLLTGEDAVAEGKTALMLSTCLFCREYKTEIFQAGNHGITES